MARQSTKPVHFDQSVRNDTAVLMTSARAGVVVPIGYAPLLPGESASGRVGIDVQLKEMPKPLLNAVHANVQAWFVPKSAHPQFSGPDELRHAMTGHAIKALGQPDRTPPPYFTQVVGGAAGAIVTGPIYKALGIHCDQTRPITTDLVDAFNLIYNFRLAAHSSKLPRRKYVTENATEANTLPPAFWPSSRFSQVVPDYDRALVMGSLDLDVLAGKVPVSGIGFEMTNPVVADVNRRDFFGAKTRRVALSDNAAGRRLTVDVGPAPGTIPEVWAEMSGQTLSVTLADIDKARTTQAFAKLRAAYAGNDTTGFDNDDAIVALLMQGISVQEEDFKRPWLLDSARVPVGFAERHATDAANLDKSVTLGRASANLTLNVPHQDVGGVIIFTVEVLPERVDERMYDDWLQAAKFEELPNALRDIQRTEPVDYVLNRRLDAKHVNPSGLYGYEPMNAKWQRDFTRLGGDFYQPTPGAGWAENRSAIWQCEIVNPSFGATHYLAPQPFPHGVFANTNGDAFECVCRHSLTITGNTQFGDVLVEYGRDYEIVAQTK